MVPWLTLGLHLAVAALKSRRNLALENLALRHQLLVLSRGSNRPRLTPLDRALWVWLSHCWKGWKTSLRIFQPDTVIQWHRAGFRLFWGWRSRPRPTGRKTIAPEIITLIRQMNQANPLWGAPRIHGELLKLGIAVAQRSVAQYMVHHTGRSPEGEGGNGEEADRHHAAEVIAEECLPVLVLYVFIVLSHPRRRVLHFNVVESPSAAWTAQQLREAFPFTSPPKYLLRDRDHRYERLAA